MIKQENTNDFAEYRYNSSAGQWVELPFDHPANDFIKKMHQAGKLSKKLSPQQAEEVLERIKTNASSGIHQHIYHNRIRPREQAGTRPFSFFWEVQDLLESVFIAHCRNPKADGEQLSKEAFGVLAEIMSQKSMDDTIEYPTAIILSDINVQRAMMQQFGADVDKRMAMVKKLAYEKPSTDPGKVTINTLLKLDELLVDLIDEGGIAEDQNQSQQEQTGIGFSQKLENLYFRLMYARDSIHKEDVMDNGRKSEYGILYRLNSSPENDKIIKQLKNSLSKYSKTITAEEIEIFKAAYLQFVSVYSPQNDMISKAQGFFRNYQTIEAYVHKTSSLEEFVEQVKSELYRFLRELFNNMEKADLGYTGSFENVFSYAQDAFAYSRLNSIHSEIWEKLHKPLWLLSSEKMIVALTLMERPFVNDYSAEMVRVSRMNDLGKLLSGRIQQLKQRIGQIHFDLQEQFPDVPLLCDFEIETLVKFVSSYNVRCPNVYGVEPLDTQELYRAITMGMATENAQHNLVMTLEIWALILKLECQKIALFLVDRAVDSLANEHNLLQEYQ